MFYGEKKIKHWDLTTKEKIHLIRFIKIMNIVMIFLIINKVFTKYVILIYFSEIPAASVHATFTASNIYVMKSTKW